jgi:hypothetical protein
VASEKINNIVRKVAWRYKPSRSILVRSNFAKNPDAVEVTRFNSDAESCLITDETKYEIRIHIISNRPRISKRVLQFIGIEETRIINGDKSLSFSALCNSILKTNSDGINIVISDKCFPSKHDLEQMVKLIRSGIGLVGIFRFGCFGVHPIFLKKVGYFDENFIGGGYEDGDMVLRSFEEDISVRLYEAIKYFPLPSSWNSELAKKYFNEKWIIDSNNLEMPKRRNTDYMKKIGQPIKKGQHKTLLDSSFSRLGPGSAGAGLDEFL